jgi:hypothetical protein
MRPNGRFLGFALVLAIAATVFGAMAVPSEDHGESAAGHDEHSTHVADHEGEDEEDDVLDAGEGLAALAVSVLATALIPIGIRTGSTRGG